MRQGRGTSAGGLCPDLAITQLLVAADPDTGVVTSVQHERGTTTSGEPFGFEGMLVLRLGDDGLVREAWELVRLL